MTREKDIEIILACACDHEGTPFKFDLMNGTIINLQELINGIKIYGKTYRVSFGATEKDFMDMVDEDWQKINSMI